MRHNVADKAWTRRGLVRPNSPKQHANERPDKALTETGVAQSTDSTWFDKKNSTQISELLGDQNV